MVAQPAGLNWARDAIDRTARQFDCDDRTAATIWWYMNSSTFFEHALPNPDVPAVRARLDTIVAGLAAETDVTAASLKAIATDSLANRALERADAETATGLAAQLGLPAPRFVEIEGRAFVRRASCCLIYRSPAGEMCISCPKRTPEERAGLLTELVRRGR